MIADFEILGRTFSCYMFLALAGVFAALFVAYKTAEKNGLNEIDMLYMVLFAFVGVVLGGHIMYGVTNADKLIYLLGNIGIIKSFGDFIDCILIVFGGSVFYGGLIGAIIAAYIYLRKKKLDMGAYFDVAAIAIPLFHTFGRIGCFLSGCCYGVEWEHGIVYHNSLIETANEVARFPVQLAEAAANLMIFILIYRLYKRRRLQNRLLVLYLTVYPICRFILEFFRGDEYRGYVGALSTSQFISLLILLAVGCFLIYSSRKKRMAN